MKTVLAPDAPWPHVPEPPKPKPEVKPVPKVKPEPKPKRVRRTDHTDAKFNEWLKNVGAKNV